MNSKPQRSGFQFSLRMAVGVITALAVTLGMLRAHGAFAIGLLLPPLALAAVVVYLWRHGRVAASAAILAIYLLAWAYTSVFGTADVTRKVVDKPLETTTEYAEIMTVYTRVPYAPSLRLERDPYLSRTHFVVPAPWHYIGAASPPCPFVVCVEFGHMYGPQDGSGGKAYFFWCCGQRWYLT